MSPPTATRRISSRKRWAFRGLAVLLGLLLVVILELICVAFDWGSPTDFDDPFVGFSEVHPLFELDEAEERYEIPPSRRRFFAVDSFPREKSAKTFRIFTFGGSTVQGHPFSIETSFPTFLELGLKAADPARDWESINCGGVSYASYRLVPILEECLGYQPDLLIICTGHNEFLEDRTYAELKHGSGFTKQLSRMRLFTLLRHGLQSEADDTADAQRDRPIMPADADVILDYQRGAEIYRRDDAWQAAVAEHYEFNLRRMIALARANKIPVLLVLPPSNLGDSPPFKSEHRNDLTTEQRTEVDQLMQQAQQHYRTDLRQSIEFLRSAIAIDDRYALAWYELGQCLRTMGESAEARRAFVRARDEDVCPLRMISRLEAALRRVARDTRVPLLDAQELLEGRCDDGILDEGQLVDHIHPSFFGYERMADALIEQMAELELVQPTDGWKPRAQAEYDWQLQSLDSFYYLNGKETLRAVQRWAAGRSDGPSAIERFPHRFGESLLEEPRTDSKVPLISPEAESSPSGTDRTREPLDVPR